MIAPLVVFGALLRFLERQARAKQLIVVSSEDDRSGSVRAWRRMDDAHRMARRPSPGRRSSRCRVRASGPANPARCAGRLSLPLI